ncbi:MAG: ABC transporter permease [Actinomycetia bacterium]|nr:ABC transporter permease [Actinomycetes bacterium]MCP4963443.1 ABC transporter permease [Actinomycetes bacterium]
MGTPAAFRVAYRDLLIYRRVWKANLAGALFQPLMYLLGIGLGVGALVDKAPDSASALGGVSYLAFYASAIMATTSMFTAGQEALWPMMDGFRWSNAYRAMISTPLEPTDVVTGVAVYFACKTAVGATGVAMALTLFDDTRSWGLVAAVPVAVLTGLAFALPLTAWTSTRDSDRSFPPIMRFILIPMFLFGGVFFPIEQLPDWLEPVAWAAPLWHGVELCRGIILDSIGPAKATLHLLVLIGFAGGGWVVCTQTFRRTLRP